MAENETVREGELSIEEVGATIYGYRWQTPLAKDLGITPRAIRYWIESPNSVSEKRWEEIANLLEQRADSCHALSSKIRSSG